MTCSHSRDVAGARNPRYSHGMAGTKIYSIWAEMIARCSRRSHPRYADYGGRGLLVSADWHRFANFYRDMGERPEGLSLDRLDNSVGYSKENCAWRPVHKQNTNKRNNRFIRAFNTELPITWWARLLRMGSSDLNKQLKHHHIEDLIMKKVGHIGANEL